MGDRSIEFEGKLKGIRVGEKMSNTYDIDSGVINVSACKQAHCELGVLM